MFLIQQYVCFLLNIRLLLIMYIKKVLLPHGKSTKQT